jgi:hypothetical protein
MDRRAKAVPNAIKRGISTWVVRAHRTAHKLLSGSGQDAPGSYPVPIRTGQLRRAEDYVLPGRSKHGIHARDNEGWLVNPAAYASAIHEGHRATRQGARFSVKPRRFIADAIADTKGAGMRGVSMEIRKALMGGF